MIFTRKKGINELIHLLSFADSKMDNFIDASNKELMISPKQVWKNKTYKVHLLSFLYSMNWKIIGFDGKWRWKTKNE